MKLAIEDLNDQTKFRKILTLSYEDILQFVFEYLKKLSGLMYFFWTVCFIFLLIMINVRIGIAGYYHIRQILFHSTLGFIVFPLICVPFHELLHVILYFISGARNIRVGMDMKQYLFYVTAHKYVATPLQFWIVALLPFILISTVALFLAFVLPGLWKWSFSIFLFAHSTMCAGDFALLNFYFLNRKKKIYTYDDADLKEAYFFEEIR